MLNYKLQQPTNLKLVIKSTNKEISMNKKYKILVVDDQTININVAQQFLNILGYSAITVAENGKEALEFINDDYDLILLDIGLPDINGFEVCKSIRAMSTKQIPIIAVTANMINDEFIERCNIAGIDDALNKPYKINDLGLKIEQWLNKYKIFSRK